jgi:hypothetical protein
MKVSEGQWSVSISDADDIGAFVPVGWRRSTIRPTRRGRETGPVHAFVELRGHRGPSSIAAVGGEWHPDDGDSVVEVADSGDLTTGASADALTESGAKLVPGLPEEFAVAVLDGFLAAPCSDGIVAGVYRIDRGGYDEVESSQIVFERASGLLRCVLGVLALGFSLNPDAVAELVRSWDT